MISTRSSIRHFKERLVGLTSRMPRKTTGVWAGFLTVNGPAWDGSEKSLPAYREWFAYYAADAG